MLEQMQIQSPIRASIVNHKPCGDTNQILNCLIVPNKFYLKFQENYKYARECHNLMFNLNNCVLRKNRKFQTKIDNMT